MRPSWIHTVCVLIMHMVAGAIADSVVVGYHSSWKRAQLESVNFAKYTHINMAFGIPTAAGEITFEGEQYLAQDVAKFHSLNLKVLLSVGGWTGSNLISDILKDTTANAAFIDSIISWIQKYDLDGIDIDWEYPGRKGNTCNSVDETNDTPNFLEFIKALRAKMTETFADKEKLITMAVYVQPFFVGGAPSSDVSEFAKYVDFISLMQYDINGGWNTVTGPNAPFDYEQGKGLQASFVSAIDAWTGAGWPANQLVAGIAFYGRSTIASVDMTLDPTNQYQSQNSSVPLGDSDDAPWTDTCAGSTANGGLWKWGNLRSQGVLTDPKTAAEPWVRQWDPISQTPWLFNPSTKQFISYDDTESLKVKVDYAASKGLAGTMVWAMEMDYNDELLDVLLTFSGGAVDTDNNMASSIALPSASRDTAASTRKPVSLESISSKSIRPAIDQKAVVIGPADTEEQLGGDSQFVEEGQEEECTVEGDYKCADSEGQSPEYFFCAQKKWLSLSCASGTVCWLTSGVMSCGWPTTS